VTVTEDEIVRRCGDAGGDRPGREPSGAVTLARLCIITRIAEVRAHGCGAERRNIDPDCGSDCSVAQRRALPPEACGRLN